MPKVLHLLMLFILTLFFPFAVYSTPNNSTHDQAVFLVEQIQAIIAAANAIQISSSSYVTVTNETIKPLLTTDGLKTSWGTDIVIGAPTEYTFKVTIPKVPEAICVLFVKNLSTYNGYTHLTSCNPNQPTDIQFIWNSLETLASTPPTSTPPTITSPKLTKVIQPNQMTDTMRWISTSATHLPKEKLINAWLPGQPIYICRAPFVGADVYSKAVYPGQLLTAGCRISYAGYAFIVTQFEVLAETNKNVIWIPMTNIRKYMFAESNSNPKHDHLGVSVVIPSDTASSTFASNPYSLPNFNININGAIPIPGGYEGGNPVLICRTKQNNMMTIGKLVLFAGSDGMIKDACDIGVEDKEVIIQNGYEILFMK